MKQAKALKKILIMAGGTGGHVFPGLALAAHLQAQGIEVHWLGTNAGLEAKLVPNAKIPFHTITVGGLRGKGIQTLLTAPFKIVIAIKQALAIIKEVNPDLVIGMGGFASGPGGVASWLTKRPLIIHEQNAKAGFTNKMLARLSKHVLEAFPKAFKPLSKKTKVSTIGNPIRLDIANLPPPQMRLSANYPFRLLVLGGSLGAKALNEIVPQALAKLKPNERPEVVHQTGEKHLALTKHLYQSLGVDATLQPFIEDMAGAYAKADMVLCRAGALTVSELCTVGLGAILIPFPHATDDHQTANANFMVEHHAALCVQQRELTDNGLADIVKDFSQSPDKRLAMAQAAYELRKENVVQKIFEICREEYR